MKNEWNSVADDEPPQGVFLMVWKFPWKHPRLAIYQESPLPDARWHYPDAPGMNERPTHWFDFEAPGEG